MSLYEWLTLLTAIAGIILEEHRSWREGHDRNYRRKRRK